MVSHIAGILTATVALLALLGGGIKWLWAVVERRFEKIEKELKKCRDREDRSDARRARMWTVIEILIDALERLDPEDRLLRRAKDMVQAIKSLDHKDEDMEPAE
jgi:putative protein kinase ArgK-like GTPase of G3E family